MSSEKLKSMHDQIDKIHQCATDEVNADVLHQFIDEQESELTTLRAEMDNIKTSWALLHTGNEQLRQRIGDADHDPKDLFEAEKLALKFCDSRSIKHGTDLWIKIVDAFTSGYRMRPIPQVTARITEQDAREICEAFWSADPYSIAEWLKTDKCSTLLNKLNADRVTAVSVPDFESWWISQPTYKNDDKLASLKAWRACAAMLSASPAPTNSLEAALPKPLPYWPPCNPGCDPEFNGERSAWCADHCKSARDAMNADQCPSHESEQSTAPDSEADNDQGNRGRNYE